MATSLARQLQRLTDPGHLTLKQLTSNQKESLLFDSKEAAEIDLDTILSLGKDGLEQLVSLEPSFAEFEDSLFSEGGKDFERSVQTLDVVDKLDATIALFLRRLSPYFLLKPSHKCLEWLVRQFRVHRCNVDPLMECILPYYETKLFARVIQLLPLRDVTSKWHWLRPIQKEGSPLARLTLVQHCISEPSFLGFVCRMVKSSLQANKKCNESSLRVVIGFYCSTVIQVLEQSTVTEQLMVTLLPYIEKGLKSSNKDYRASSYMITSVLASNAILEKIVTSSLLHVISKYLGPALVEEAVQCMMVLCACAQDMNTLSNRTVRKLVVHSSTFIPAFSSLTVSHDSAASLLSLVLFSLLDSVMGVDNIDGAGKMLLDLLLEIHSSTAMASPAIRSIVDRFVNHCCQHREIQAGEESVDVLCAITKYKREKDKFLNPSSLIENLPQTEDSLPSIEEQILCGHFGDLVLEVHTQPPADIVDRVLENLVPPQNLSSAMWLNVPPVQVPGKAGGPLSGEAYYYSSLVSLFALVTGWCSQSECSSLASSGRSLLQKLIRLHFPGRGALLRFLAMIWTAPVADVDRTTASVAADQPGGPWPITAIMQVQALRIGMTYLSSLDQESALALSRSHCPLVPSLLLPLSCPHKIVRREAHQCILTLLQQATHCGDQQSAAVAYSTCPLLHLLAAISTCMLEIVSDRMGLRMLLERVFQSLNPSKSAGLELSSGKTKKSKKRADLKARSTILESILESLVTHAVVMEAPLSVQQRILDVVSDIDHERKVDFVLPVLQVLIGKCIDSAAEEKDSESVVASALTCDELAVLQLLVQCYSPAVAASLHRSQEAKRVFLSLLSSGSSFFPLSPRPATTAVAQLTPRFFSALDSSLKETVLHKLVELTATTQESFVAMRTKDCIAHLPLTADLIVGEISNHDNLLREQLIPPTPSKRARKSKAHPAVVNEEAVLSCWKQVTVFLEVIQSKCSEICDNHLLVPHLFSLLSRCVECGSKESVNVEYTQQLLLTILHQICSSFDGKSKEQLKVLVSEAQFNVELVVQCVRLSLNSHTHQTALLLLSTAASLFPGRVLHNLMPIFTFMGASILRHDDMYSFQVIDKTLDTIVPVLVKTVSHERPQGSRKVVSSLNPLLLSVTDVLRVFVDAVPHIPLHRRLPLFSRLLSTLGPAKYLYVALGLLAEKSVVLPSTMKKQVPQEAVLENKFLLSLCQEFSTPVQLTALHKLIQYLCQLPQDKPEDLRKARNLPMSVTFIFNVALHTFQQLRHFKYLVLSLVVAALSWMNKDSASVEEEETSGIIPGLLQVVWTLLGSVNSSHSLTVEENARKFWDSLIGKIHDVIDKVIALLPLNSFLSLVHQLLDNTERDMRKKTISILSARLEDPRTKFTSEHDGMMLQLMDPLLQLATSGETNAMMRQLALYAVKLLLARTTSVDKEHWIKVVEVLVTMVEEGAESLHPLVHSNALLCIAGACQRLVVWAIPLLPRVMPHLLSLLGEVKPRCELLHLSALTSITLIVKVLSKFLSSFVMEIVTKVCHPHLVVEGRKEMEELVQQAVTLRELLASQIPSRVMVPALTKCYDSVHMWGKESVVALVSVLSCALDPIGPDFIRSHSQIMLKLFMALLDYRVMANEESLSDVLEVEEAVNSSFCLLVVKMSEAAFRPVFLQLLDWSSHSSAHRDRSITFYHLTNCLAGKLKSLFLLFAGHMIENAASILDGCNPTKQDELLFQSSGADGSLEEKACLLLELVLGTLYKCFLYDNGSLLSKEHFTALLQPLVDQVCNEVGGVQKYQWRVVHHLVPCLAQFAVAAGKDDLWKKLNYQLLLKSRDSNARVRFAVLQVAQEMYSKLGEEFAVLLPETIPFLAELMEDESPEVEQHAQKTITVIEDLVGESIQQYF